MALRSAFRRVLSVSSKPSLNICSQFASIRLNSTVVPLTSPKLFVSGLSRDTTDENLYAAFAPFGSIREAKVVTDKGSGRSKGFAFVSYGTVEEAEKAREGMNAQLFDGSEIFVDPTIKFLDGWLIFDDPVVDLDARIVRQVDYYFSNTNLVRDMFLRKNMDAEGLVSIEVIASFNKIKQLTNDTQLILNALGASKNVEVRGDKVRCRNDWKRWILPGKLESPPDPPTEDMKDIN